MGFIVERIVIKSIYTVIIHPTLFSTNTQLHLTIKILHWRKLWGNNFRCVDPTRLEPHHVFHRMTHSVGLNQDICHAKWFEINWERQNGTKKSGMSCTYRLTTSWFAKSSHAMNCCIWWRVMCEHQASEGEKNQSFVNHHSSEYLNRNWLMLQYFCAQFRIIYDDFNAKNLSITPYCNAGIALSWTNDLPKMIIFSQPKSVYIIFHQSDDDFICWSWFFLDFPWPTDAKGENLPREKKTSKSANQKEIEYRTDNWLMMIIVGVIFVAHKYTSTLIQWLNL